MDASESPLLQCRRRVNPHPPSTRCGENGQHSPGRPTGRSAATAQPCAPRTLCCEAFELLRFRPGPVQPSLGPKSTRPAPSLQWAHQSNLGRTSTQRCSTLNPMKPTHSAPPLSPQEAGVSERCPPAPDARPPRARERAMRRTALPRCGAALARYGQLRVLRIPTAVTYLIGVWPDQEGSRHTNGPCIALRLERW